MTRDTDSSWAEAQAHLLAQPMSDRLRVWIESDSPYRAAYVSPPLGTMTHPKIPEPWRELRVEQPFVYGAASATEICLAWLKRQFGG